MQLPAQFADKCQAQRPHRRAGDKDLPACCKGKGFVAEIALRIDDRRSRALGPITDKVAKAGRHIHEIGRIGASMPRLIWLKSCTANPVPVTM